ncbi:MAG TPA: glycosyltransferase family 4 protein [Kiloniellales bacterium]
MAFVIQHYPPYTAGAEYQARLLSSQLGKEVERCEVITTRFDSTLPHLAKEGPVTVRRLWTFLRGNPRRVVNFFSALVYFSLRGRRYDVLHLHCFSLFTLGAILGSRLWGCRTVIKACTIGAQGDVAKVKGSVMGGLFWRIFLRCDVFLATTPEMAEGYRSDGIPPERIRLIPNIVDPEIAHDMTDELRREARAELGLPERISVVFVGRLVKQKGVESVVRAWRDVVSDLDANLIIVGDGPEGASLAEAAREGGCADSVFFVGQKPDPHPYYRAAEIFVFAARDEGFGNVIAEAMLWGLAIVSTPSGLAASWLEHERTGLIVQSDTVTEIAAALKRLIADERLRHALARGSHRAVLDLFSPHVVVPQHIRVYEEILGETQRGWTAAR